MISASHRRWRGLGAFVCDGIAHIAAHAQFLIKRIPIEKMMFLGILTRNEPILRCEVARLAQG